MRAYPHRRGRNYNPIPPPPDEGPPGPGCNPQGSNEARCFFCSINRRQLHQTLCSFTFVLIIGIGAYSVSQLLSDELPHEIKEIPILRKDVDNLKHQMDTLHKNIGSETNSLQSVGSQELSESHIIDLVRAELSRYDSDKTGMTDYALEKLGACIVSIKDTVPIMDESTALVFFGYPAKMFLSSARVILQPSMEPGSCWGFEGRGEVVIKLMSDVLISAISIEHISKSLSPHGDISSAPKDFELFGVKTWDDDNLHSFGSFQYSKEGPTLQMFEVQNPSNDPFRIIEIHFNTNHGNKHYTCVYRVRIHGKLPEQLNESYFDEEAP